jgi:hypothetical protein
LAANVAAVAYRLALTPAMPLQNRVTPTGEIVADPSRGTLMGNRGILHDASRALGAARWRHRSWICCQLSFRGRRRAVMAPRRYTELFFLDEATALAAGHRPCFECRRAAFREFQTAWRRAFGTADCSAAVMDRVLHGARVEPRTRRQIRFEAPLDDLPDGVFVLLDEAPSALLVLSDRLLPWRASGYGSARRRPAAIRCRVLTPAPTVALLQAGYVPALHFSAGRRSADGGTAGGPSLERSIRRGWRASGAGVSRLSRPPRAARAGNTASCARSAPRGGA